jgi:hypothetical protein
LERLRQSYWEDTLSAPLPGFLPPLGEVAGDMASIPPEPADPTRIPRFPLVLIDDIPLVVVQRCIVIGQAEPVMRQIAYFRRFGRLRTRPLCPSDRPWEVLAKLEASPQWLFGSDYETNKGDTPVLGDSPQDPEQNREDGRWMMRRQLLRMVAGLYPQVRETSPRWIGSGKDADTYTVTMVNTDKWVSVVADLKKHPIRWDAAHQRYKRVSEPSPSALMLSPSPSGHPFADVEPDGHWGSVYLAVERLRRAGIVVGYPPGSVPADDKPGARP